jgi:thiol:disulfide interchange protein
MTQPAHTVSPKTKQKKEVRDLRVEAQKIANSIKIEGQTPVETKAIATGIQRGIEMFLRQQSEKTRELDKRVKKVKQLSNQLTQQKTLDEKEEIPNTQTSSRLPWVLLALSWILFLAVGIAITLK